MDESDTAWLRIIPRRIAAYIVDYLCIIVYACALALLTVFVVQPEIATDSHDPSDAAFMQLIGFVTLTGPVVLVMSLLESSRRQASPGKMLLGLRVRRPDGSRLSFARSLGRNAMKFLPWEISHTGVHQLFVTNHPLPWLGVSLANLGMVLVAGYLVSCLTGRGRTVYDRMVDADVA